MGKRTQKLMLKDLAKKTLNLGYVGENDHTQIIIDCSEVFWDYPNAVPVLNVQPPRGDKYPATQITKDGDDLIWTISDSDIIYAGNGRIQLKFTNNGEIVKSAVGSTKIDGSIETTGDAPAPLEDWMDRAEETAEQIAENAAATVLENYDELVDDVSSLKSAFGNAVKQQIAFVQTANSTTNNYYKTFTMLSNEKCYLIRLTVDEAGTYTLRIGTGQSSGAMVDTVGTATVQANVPYDFIGYVPSLSTFTTSRLSVSTEHSIAIYEIIDIDALKDKITDIENELDSIETDQAVLTKEQDYANRQSMLFLQDAVDTSATYYKTVIGLSTLKVYAFEVSITETPGTYTLKFGTGQSSASMVDTVGTAKIEVGKPHLFFGYTPTGSYTTARLEPAETWSMKVYEVPYIPGAIDINNIIPTYYRTYIENKGKEINAMLNDSGLSGDTFLFMTDYHRQANTKNSASLAKYLLDHTGINFIAFGGDTQDYTRTFESAMNETSGMYSDYSSVKDHFYSVRGNHEYNYHYVRDEGYPESIMLTYDQIYRIENKRQELSYYSVSPLGDIAIENKIQKIRYYFIGCDKTVEIENQTRKWLFDDFYTLPDGYNVVIFSHKTFDISGSNLVVGPRVQSIVNAMVALNNKSSFSYSPDGVLTTYNYANVNAHAWCIIGGHLHFDADSTEEVVSGYSSDILITSTTCDAYARQNSNGFQHNVLTRTAGTITEQAFDVCQIDFTNKKLYMKRIGAGSDRTYNLV